MPIRRTLPPAAVPIRWKQIRNGLSGWRRGKKEIERFRQELISYFGGRPCYLVSSGKAALYLVLDALRKMHPERDEVLIPAFTCYSVPSAIVRAGLKVRLCDVNRETLDFDEHALNQFINKKQKDTQPSASRLLAIIPTHLFGLEADVTRLRSLLRDPEVTIIEDAAQTFGGRNREGLLGCTGDVGIFSLGRGKSFSTISGGVIITSQRQLASAIEAAVDRLPASGLYAEGRLLAYALALCLLLHPNRFWLPRTLPFLRLGETIYDPDFEITSFSPFQAGLARGWEHYLEQLRSARHVQAKAWRRSLANISSILIPPEDDEKNLIRYPITLPAEHRRMILEKADAASLGMMPAYPDCIAAIPELKCNLHSSNYPQASTLARELLTLPVHPFVTNFDRNRTIRLLSTCTHPR